MSPWMWALLLAIQGHFAASYVAALPPELRLSWFNYLWPWAKGDRGLFGVWPTFLGIILAGLAALASLLAALAVISMWVHHPWWRSLAMAGSALSLILMTGFFGPTKLLPIALNLVVLLAVGVRFRVPA